MIIEDKINKSYSKITVAIKGFVVFVVGLIGVILLIGILGGAGYFLFKHLNLVHWLILTIFILLTMIAVACYYLYKFVSIIMVFEDDLSDTIEALNECEESLEHVISLRLFFENEQVRPILETAKNEVVMCRMKVRQMATRFVERSNQKYVILEEPIEIEKVRGIPGSINDSLMTNRILGYKRELGDEADVMFATDREIAEYKSFNKNRQ